MMEYEPITDEMLDFLVEASKENEADFREHPAYFLAIAYTNVFRELKSRRMKAGETHVN